MKNFKDSIRFRVWLLFVGFTTLMLIFLYCTQVFLLPVFYKFMKTQEITQTLSIIKSSWDSENLKTTVDHLASNQQMDIMLNIPAETPFGQPFTYYAKKSGSPTVSLSQSVSDTIKEELLNSKTGTLFLPTSDEGKDTMLLASYVGTADDIEGYIFIYSYLEPMGTTSSILKNLLIMSSSILLVLAFCLSIFISSQISRPIVKISRSANKLITGEFNMAVKPNEYAEIAILKENLNEASKEIAKTENLRKDLMANISHDLRTPLTMIKAYAEMIRDLSGDNPEKREKHLKVIIDETDRLTALVADVLSLSKLQSGVVEMNMTEFNFSEHLTGIISRFGFLKDTEDCAVQIDAEPDIYISADITKLEQVVYNLVNNAINYTGDDRTVRVKLYRKDDKNARFEVSDSGVGIRPEDLPYIWEKYYKVDRSENHKRVVKGTGLGLSIVKGVLEAHHYKYGVDSELGKGSTFWFEFPMLDINKTEEKEPPLLKE